MKAPLRTIVSLVVAFASLQAFADGTRQQHRPIWSPDGTSLIFMSDRSHDWELYKMQLDGAGLQRLTNHLGWDGYASVSDDGMAMLYDRREGGFTIVLRDLDTGREKVLVSETVFTGSPRWLPGGDAFLFVSEKSGNRDIYQMSRNGDSRRRVTDTPENEHDPAPSPDGRRVVMAVKFDKGAALDIMNLDGSGRRRLVTSDGYLYGPAWSPDGKWITFNTDEDGDQEIFKIEPDGSNRTRLTDNETPDHQANWSPNGRHLVFTSERNGREEIFLMDPDGSDVMRLAAD